MLRFRLHDLVWTWSNINFDTIWRNSALHSLDLTSRLDSLKSKGTPSSDALNEITLEIAKLRKELTDAVAYLPTYDQRQYELVSSLPPFSHSTFCNSLYFSDKHIKTIEKSLTDLRTASTSKSKFSFKRKQPTQTSSSVNTTASANPLTTDSRPTTNPSQSNSRILSDRSKEYLTLASLPESSTASDLTITNLDHCIVNLLPDNPDERRSITALHVRDVTNSIFILPSSIDGSAMFHNISKSIMVLGCHQVCFHDSLPTPSFPVVVSHHHPS